jgi:hypothetical protein
MVAGHATRDASCGSDGHGDPIRVVDTSRPGARGACPSPPVGCPGAFDAALSPNGPSAVAGLAAGVAAVARCAGADSTDHRRPVASRSVRSALVAPFATSWTTTHRFAVSRFDSALGRGESSLGRSADSRRAAQARTRRLRTHRVAVPAECPRRPSQTWGTLLANHLAQFALISPVMSPYVSGDDVVDAAAVTSRSSPMSDRLSASSQFGLIDWRASVRRTCVGSRIAQDSNSSRGCTN